MRYSERPKIKDSPEDIAMQEAIRSRANYSLAILGMSFVYRGSGRFLNLRPPCEAPRRANAKSIDNTV
jgi:hypothetical protein